jgi:hypothetical protein
MTLIGENTFSIKAMFYIVYQSTNRLNQRYYIGWHKTHDLADGYLGSGKRLRREVHKYGGDSFTREVLFCCDSAVEAFAKEREIVRQHLGNPLCLNLADGGHGGWTRSGPPIRNYTPTIRANISASKTGSRNPNYGTVWVMKDDISTRVPKGDLHLWLAGGWVRGRVFYPVFTKAAREAISKAVRSAYKAGSHDEAMAYMAARTRGTKRIYKGDVSKRIPPSEVTSYLGVGWVLGMSPKVRAKLAAATTERMKFEKAAGIKRVRHPSSNAAVGQE